MKKKQKLKILEYELPIVIQQEKGGYFATCPLWNDCYAQGKTIEEVINEISYIASSLIELYKEEGFEIPLKLKKASQKSVNALAFKFPLIISPH